ncbi:MAG: hypothetical protein ACPGOV_05645 [Magnetovibrionaceae bacterium]
MLCQIFAGGPSAPLALGDEDHIIVTDRGYLFQEELEIFVEVHFQGDALWVEANFEDITLMCIFGPEPVLYLN